MKGGGACGAEWIEDRRCSLVAAVVICLSSMRWAQKGESRRLAGARQRKLGVRLEPRCSSAQLQQLIFVTYFVMPLLLS